MSPSRDPIHVIVRARKRPVLQVSGAMLVWDAAQAMTRADVGAVVVAREPGAWGILSERDIVRKVTAKGLDPAQVRVEDAMWWAAPKASPDAPVEAVMAYLAQLERRHVLVTRGHLLLGIVSLGDLAAHTTAALERDVQDLMRYVHGAHENEKS